MLPMPMSVINNQAKQDPWGKAPFEEMLYSFVSGRQQKSNDSAIRRDGPRWKRLVIVTKVVP